MKAMILAAGRGKRLKPLTNAIPKPIIPVGHHRLIEHNIFRLREAGVKNIVINVCYLAKQIIEHLGNGSRYGVNIEYSFEGDSCLGTGGGIYRALPLLGNSPFWLVSADIWGEFQFNPMHLNKNTQAHLIMVPNPEFHSQGDYGISTDGKLNFEEPKLTYAGIAFIDPKIFKECKPGIFSFSPVINQTMQNSSVSAELFSGLWFNIGTEKELNRLREMLLLRTPSSS